MKATVLIRREGFRQRMEPPQALLARTNILSMQMSHAASRARSKNPRKRVLRHMKRLLGVAMARVRRHRGERLVQDWVKTSWTRRQAEGVLWRIDGVLALLPRARRQAH